MAELWLGDIRMPLALHVLVGRGRRCDFLIAEPTVSNLHALIFWRQERWWLRDLGSRNGTWVDGERVPVGVDRELSLAHRITFGLAQWAPTFALRRNEGTDAPDGDCARPVRIHATSGQWSVSVRAEDDTHGSEQSTCDASPLRVVATVLHVHMPADDAMPVLLDLEVPSGREIRLRPRAHHRVLAALALRWSQDRAHGMPPEACGWMSRDELADELDVSESQIDTDVHRARAELLAIGMVDADRVVQRTSVAGDGRSRRMRLGFAAVEIEAP